MRSTTTQSQAAALASLKDLATHVRVSVDDGTGSYTDLTDLEGYNWIHSVTYNEKAGQPTVTATVKLTRENHKLSLSPFVDGSKLNASGTVVDIGRKIKIETAVLPAGKGPATNEWEEIFRGYIEDIEWERNPMVLKCQDLGSELVAWFIENQYVYATTDNALDEVVQDIVDDNNPSVQVVAAEFTWNGNTTVTATGGDTSELSVDDYIGYTQGPYFQIDSINPNVSVTILNPFSRTIPSGDGAGSTLLIEEDDRISLQIDGAAPAWAIHEYYQTKDRLLPAIRRIAQQIGYEINYRWNSSTEAFELTLWEPDRSASTPDVTIGPGQYKDVKKLNMSRSKIRNKIRVTAEVSGVVKSVVREDAASQAKYGVRYMEATRKSTDQIDTQAELQDFGDIILADLKDPGADLSVTIPYRWDLEIGDYVRFSADNVRFDTDQDFGVVSLSHTLPNRGEPTTTIGVRGKPSGGVNRWLELEGMPGVAPPVDLKSDNAAENVAASAGASSVTITYDDPRSMSPPINDWATTLCYLRYDADPGDPPGASYLVAAGKQTRFEIGGLIPGGEYQGRLVIMDEGGNIAATSTVVVQATQKVTAYHMDEDSTRAVRLPNGDFGTQTLDVTTNPPDSWSMGTAGWGAADDVYIDTTEHQTGSRSIVFQDAGGDMWSDYFPVNEGEILAFEMVLKLSANSVGGTFRNYVRYYTNARPTILTTTSLQNLDLSALSTGTWLRYVDRLCVPTNARYAKIRLSHVKGATTHDVFVDRHNVVKDSDAVNVERNSTQSINSGTWTTILFNNVIQDYSSSYNSGTGYYYGPAIGAATWLFSASSEIASLGAGKEVQLRIAVTQKGSTRYYYGTVSTPSSIGNTCVHATTGPIDIVAADAIVVQIKHNHGSALNIPANGAFFRGVQGGW